MIGDGNEGVNTPEEQQTSETSYKKSSIKPSNGEVATETEREVATRNTQEPYGF